MKTSKINILEGSPFIGDSNQTVRHAGIGVRESRFGLEYGIWTKLVNRDSFLVNRCSSISNEDSSWISFDDWLSLSKTIP